jgi:hypothetical protein
MKDQFGRHFAITREGNVTLSIDGLPVPWWRSAHRCSRRLLGARLSPPDPEGL